MFGGCKSRKLFYRFDIGGLVIMVLFVRFCFFSKYIFSKDCFDLVLMIKLLS